MLSAALFLLGVIVSVVAIRYGIVASHKLGIVDQPGGHKAHDTVTPFVGGVGVLVATLSAVFIVSQFFPQFTVRALPFVFGVVAMFITGFADDILHLGYKKALCVLDCIQKKLKFYISTTVLNFLDTILANFKAIKPNHVIVQVTRTPLIPKVKYITYLLN